jgi:hypothetical protein
VRAGFYDLTIFVDLSKSVPSGAFYQIGGVRALARMSESLVNCSIVSFNV